MKDLFSFRLTKMFLLHKVTMSEEEEFDILNAVMAFACVTCAALAAGLTLVSSIYTNMNIVMESEVSIFLWLLCGG